MPNSYSELDKVATLLKKNPHIGVEINGHTDSKGDDKYNFVLSEKRAKAVGYYLSEKGINNARLKPKGFGERKPIAPNLAPDGNDNPEGRKKNRRTEINIIRL